MLMKAAVLYEINQPLVLEEIEIPEPAFGQVCVQVKASGVCRKQFQEVHGLHGPDPYLPHLLGHEGAGIVEAVGPGVTRVKAGDHVVLSWIKAKGLEPKPPVYHRGTQRIHAGAVTTFNQYTLAAENRVTHIPKDLPFDKAALFGCAIPTGVGVVFNTAKVKAGSSVAVFGAGGIGLNIIQACALVGATMIIAVDLYDQKLEQARRLGATHTINAAHEDPVSRIKEWMEGKGVDYAFEASASREGMENAYACVRWGSGLSVLVGNLPHGDRKISIDPSPLYAGTRLIGTWGGETDPDRDFPRYVEWYLNGKLKIDELITHRFPLEEINLALQVLNEGDVGRAIIEF